ncbi:30S ribosomal protein S5 [Candidatus Woesearchaeota archaeon]|nr:30S ribosomal protein S5 [Candidatus Woesearchaeota archaeon]
MARRKRPDAPKKNDKAAPRSAYGEKELRSSGQSPRASQESSSLDNWKPKTLLGSKVKNREIFHIDEILDRGQKVLEPEIIDSLLSLEQDLLMVGQSKGKFGGGARRVFRQTQKKTMEGNKPKFATVVVVGDKNGHVGLGFGKAKETVPAREKAIRKAKLNLFKIRRGCGSWQCNCGKPHSIPFTVTGKCGSIEIKFIPAPKGKGLCCQKEIAKVLELAGIKDVWVKTRGQTRNLLNFVYACEDALHQLMQVKLKPEDINRLGVIEGSIEQPALPDEAGMAVEGIVSPAGDAEVKKE